MTGAARARSEGGCGGRAVGGYRRWQRPAAIALAIVLWEALVLLLSPMLRAATLGWLAAPGAPPGSETVVVTEVIDGDTLVIEDGRTVRLLGLDTPETHRPGLEHAQALGDEATVRLAALVEGQVVALERDVTEVDHYGRLLRHVWRGRTLVAETLLREGLARSMSIPPDLRHRDRLRAAEARARAARVGLWGLPRPTSLPIFASAGED